MEPISVHSAKPGEPFTIRLTSDAPTIQDLHAALAELIAMGYGGTPFVRADYEGSLALARNLELYDTSKEMERGEVSSRQTFLLC